MTVRQRWSRVAFGLAATVMALAVCSGAAGAGGPLVLLAGTEGGGGPSLGGSAPTGVTIRFIDHGRFFVGVLLHNGSHQTVTVTGAQTPEPVNSLVRQVGTRLGPFKPCKGDIICSSLPSGAYAARLRPVTLKPGADVGVQLNYQLGSCGDVPLSSLATANVLQVSYKDSTGALQQQAFPIGGARLHLQKPAGVECVPRPYSHIGLVGSFTTSPGHKPVPGSDGDTCTKSAAGQLVYRSRLFNDRSGVQFRVEIVFPHFSGKGVYGTLGGHATGAGAGDRVRRVRRPRPDNLSRPPRRRHRHAGTAPLYGGRFQATLSGHRRFFRAYGAWRCTTKLR